MCACAPTCPPTGRKPGVAEQTVWPPPRTRRRPGRGEARLVSWAGPREGARRPYLARRRRRIPRPGHTAAAHRRRPHGPRSHNDNRIFGQLIPLIHRFMRCARRLPALLALAAGLGRSCARPRDPHHRAGPSGDGRTGRAGLRSSTSSPWRARETPATSASRPLSKLQYVESWKGGLQPGTHLTVLQPGGTVGDMSNKTVDVCRALSPANERWCSCTGRRTARRSWGLTQGKRRCSGIRPAAGGWCAAQIGPVRISFDCVRRATAAPASQVDARERPFEELRAQVHSLAAAK